MQNKVLGFLRETLQHENEVEGLSIDLAKGQVDLKLIQPDEHSSWPDHELTLTFTGVVEFSGQATSPLGSRMLNLLGLECRYGTPGGYRVEIVAGEGPVAAWTVLLTFSDLAYRRT